MISHITYWYKKYYSTLLSLCIALLFADVIIDPTNKIFHLKYILFAMPFLVWLPQLFTKKILLHRSFAIVLFFVCLFMPIYAISFGLINNFVQNTTIGELVYLNSFFFFLIILIVFTEQLDLTRFFNYSSLIIVAITGISYSVLLYNPNTFGLLYDYFVVDKNVAVYGLRKYGDYTLLMMFYKTSPLLIFPLSYYFYQLLIQQNNRHIPLKIIALIAIALTLFLSGTRANILSLALIILFYIIFYAYKKSKPIFFVLGFVYLLLAFYSITIIGDLLLSRSEISNIVKFGHITSYIEYFSNNVGVLIFGQGIGGTFYSTGINSIVNVTELTYFELIRIWGIPISICFFTILLFPIYKELQSKNISHLFIAYIAYLFIAGTNPLLLSSTGMLVLVYVFSKVYSSKDTLRL